MILDWIRHATSLWITPFQRKISPVIHKDWLKDKECDLVNNLTHGRLLIKDRVHNKCIVAKVQDNSSLPVPHLLRQTSLLSSKKCRPCRLQKAVNLTFTAPQSLYKQLCRIEILRLAWLKVRRGKKNSKGIDGVTIAVFAEQEEKQLTTLAMELHSKTYRPRPLRRMYLSKPDGGQRAIGIGCVRDRVVQAACLSVIEPLYEPDFSNFSFAFRPRRSAHQALTLAAGYMAGGYKWIVAADIKKCFDNIDQQLLLQMLEKKIGDQEILTLISNWLTIDVVEFQDVIPILSGVPQGAVLSPFLANVFLDSLDKFFEKSGFSFLRYADDIAIFTYDENTAEKALQAMQSFLQDSLHLALKPAKTQYVKVEEGIDFLGFTLQGCKVCINKTKIAKINDTLGRQIKLLGRHRSLQGIFDCMLKLNGLIRGIRNYFSMPLPGKINTQLQGLDILVAELGNQFLPENLQKESIWQMRERFFLQENRLAATQLEGNNQIQLVGTGYPQEALPTILNDSEDQIEEQKVQLQTVKKEPLPVDSFAPLVTEDNQIHILSHGCLLTTDQEFIILKKKKKEIWKRRLTQSSSIFLQGKGNSITTALQIELSKYEIPLFY